jgi:hypothetical protein
MTRPRALIRGAATVGGDVLALATGGLAFLRSSAKPLHPSGEVRWGRLTRRGTDPLPAETTGVGWIDEPGEDKVVVRLSRAVGLPEGLPDIHGLALRIVGHDAPADVLFANTGTGRLTRFLLMASRDPRTRPMTTLLPYRTTTGPLLLRVDHAGGEAYGLSWARPSSGWHSFGTLELEQHPADDPQISFDPVLHQLPGLSQYPVVLRLREPAYLRARRSRT